MVGVSRQKGVLKVETENTTTAEATETEVDAVIDEAGNGQESETEAVSPEIAEKLADLRAQVAHKADMLKEGKSNMAGAATRKINQLSDELRALGVEETLIDAINNGTDDVERPLEGEQATAEPQAASTPKRKAGRPEPEAPKDRKKGDTVLAYHPRLHPGNPSPATVDQDFQAVNTYVWVIFWDNGLRVQPHKNNVFSVPDDFELPEKPEFLTKPAVVAEAETPETPAEPEQDTPNGDDAPAGGEQPGDGESQTEEGGEQAETPAETEPAQS